VNDDNDDDEEEEEEDETIDTFGVVLYIAAFVAVVSSVPVSVHVDVSGWFAAAAAAVAVDSIWHSKQKKMVKRRRKASESFLWINWRYPIEPTMTMMIDVHSWSSFSSSSFANILRQVRNDCRDY